MKTASMLAIALSALLVTAPSGLAQGTDRDDGDDDAEHKVKSTLEGHRFVLEVEREDAGREDGLKIEFETKKAEFRLEYETEAADIETEQKLRASFQALAEYVDENGNGRYDSGEPVASAYLLGDEDLPGVETDGGVSWAPLAARAAQSDDGRTGQLIEARGAFGPDGSALFGINAYVFEETASLAGETFTPTQLKFDILVQGYPYAQDGSALALFVSTLVESEFESEAREIDDAEGVVAEGRVDGDTVALQFTWVDHAVVDGASTAVGSTTIAEKTETETEPGESESKSERLFALSYARGDDILHDPVIGVQYGAARGAPMPGMALLVAAVAAAAVAHAARRR